MVSAQTATATTEPAGNALAPGDVLRIAIWREPDLSGDFLVDETGVVTLPLLGKRNVLTTPLAALRDSLIAEYAVQLRNPSVTITPLRRIYVLGEVTKPGLYIVDPTISLAGAVALAGGASPNGDLGRVRVMRNGQVVLGHVAAGSSLSAANIRSEDQVFVDRRGWLDRNSTVAASALVSAATVIISLLLR
ncbi:MAG: polysaccharide biosynthesis/export family protein [Chloroflexota bacterium]|nr:polysaccharide biosynthesis/export family protein [Chloroflexota bacterium]